MPVRVTLDVAALQTRIAEDKKRAQHMVGEQIMADCLNFIPKQEGTLRDTAHMRDGDDGTEIIWDTPYAAYQYYGCWPDGSHVIRNHTTPGTTTQWVEAAKQRYGKDWAIVAGNAIKRG